MQKGFKIICNKVFLFALLSSVAQYTPYTNSRHCHEDEKHADYFQRPGGFIEEQNLEDLQSFIML